MKKLSALLILFIFAAQLFAQDIQLATEYYKKGEFDKAAELYEKISLRKENSIAIHNNYLNSLLRIADYTRAEKFIKQEIKWFPELINYKADLAYLYEVSNRIDEANKAYENLINLAVEKDVYVYQLQNFLYRTNKIDLLIELLLKSRELSGVNDKHNTLLARAYLYAGKKEEMLLEVFSYGLAHPKSAYVSRTIQDNIKEEEELDMLQKLIYRKIQENPGETYFTELLIWHFTQQKEFSKAFFQSRALDRRLGLEGNKVFGLAGLAYENKAYREAAQMYQYIMKTYPEGDFYPSARRFSIQCSEQIIKNTYPISESDIVLLIAQYDELLLELGENPKTIDALRNSALLYAFYLNDQVKAVEMLKKAISKGASNDLFKDQCKIDLGDIYILKQEPWESTLLYMQVEKSQKESSLGELAKLKNAKLYYYTGEFELAKDVLDILKKATSREIANDAMKLSLLIQDNLGLDTTDAAMKAYAAIDLLLFQNKNEKARKDLDSLYKSYKQHSLADEILWMRATTNKKLGNRQATILDLNELKENYKYDILADDAIFMLAEIYYENPADKEIAMSYYKKLLEDYPGSIYGAEARKKFRSLRGDFIY